MNEILIYQPIGENFWEPEKSMTGETIKSQLEGDVTVRIDSPGGDVFAGFAIYNQLVQHDGKVTVYVDGAAASAASIIAMAGDEVYLPETSVMMIHDPWTMAIGDSSDMKKTAELLDTIKDAIIPAYTAKTGLETEKISDMMSEETWLTGAQAAQMGFGTLIEGGKQTASNFERPWIKNAPKPEPKAPKPEQIAPEQPQNKQQKPYKTNLQKRRLKLAQL
jgi:ATP-dependent Clp protease, protease subunit